MGAVRPLARVGAADRRAHDLEQQLALVRWAGIADVLDAHVPRPVVDGRLHHPASLAQSSEKRNAWRSGGCGACASSQRTGASPALRNECGQPDPGPEEVAGAHREALAAGVGLDLPLEHAVGLLERMVVRADLGAGLELDHEQRVERRVEVLVDEHPDRGAAEDELRSRHASAGGLGIEAEEMAVARIADVDRRLGLGVAEVRGEGVGKAGAGLRRTRHPYLDPAGLLRARLPAVGDADGQ